MSKALGRLTLPKAMESGGPAGSHALVDYSPDQERSENGKFGSGGGGVKGEKESAQAKLKATQNRYANTPTVKAAREQGIIGQPKGQEEGHPNPVAPEETNKQGKTFETWRKEVEGATATKGHNFNLSKVKRQLKSGKAANQAAEAKKGASISKVNKNQGYSLHKSMLDKKNS